VWDIFATTLLSHSRVDSLQWFRGNTYTCRLRDRTLHLVTPVWGCGGCTWPAGSGCCWPCFFIGTDYSRPGFTNRPTVQYTHNNPASLDLVLSKVVVPQLRDGTTCRSGTQTPTPSGPQTTYRRWALFAVSTVAGPVAQTAARPVLPRCGKQEYSAFIISAASD
jgi:hypothetical protein